MAPARILVVEDRDSLRRLLRRALEDEGYAVTEAADGPAARRELAHASFELVLTDLKLPIGSGLEVLADSRTLQPAVPVLVMTAYGTVRDAVEAMKLGALDFLEKPVEVDELLRRVAAAVRRGDDRGDDDGDPFTVAGAPPIVGRHPRLRSALRLLERVAATDSTVLLTGESGTGKELFARALHALSRRAGGPFVAINCAALPEALLENELFGHEKGAFTGADRRHAGRFERAHGGTLFLDEIGELAGGVQAKVLRVLEDRTFERVGGGTPLKTDARLVAATNRDLSQMVEAGDFRADLFYRLQVFPIDIPPLRERREDVPLLTRHLLGELARRHARPALEIADDALELLADRPWPGNVRELSNLLERAVIVSDQGPLSAQDLAALLPVEPAATTADEGERIRAALAATDGDKQAAAARLGLSYRTLQRRILAHDLEGYPRYRS